MLFRSFFLLCFAVFDVFQMLFVIYEIFQNNVIGEMACVPVGETACVCVGEVMCAHVCERLTNLEHPVILKARDST